MAIEEQINQKNGQLLPPLPEGRPPSVREALEYQRHEQHHFEDHEADLIPTTVTELCQDHHQMHQKVVQDLYKILTKLSGENRSLRLSLAEQQSIIEGEVSK